ncbi:hypothetical protein [Caproiciproducens galactitolivorans]|nr:hypothetical protein [Caproiciproducens galactitolivorans]
MNAGELNEQISVLELQQIGIVCGWNVKRVMFGKVEKLNKTNLFS